MSKLDILFINDGIAWTAQCLQYDIAAQGSTIKEAKTTIEFAIVAEAGYLAETNKTLDDLSSAPQYFWKIYDDATELAPLSRKPLRVSSKISELLNLLIPNNLGLRVA